MGPNVRKGSILVYRVFDVAEEVDLSSVENILRHETGKSRLRITRGGRNAVVMRNPPVRVSLGEQTFQLAGETTKAEAAATIWDYGVVSIVFQIPIAPDTPMAQLIGKSASLNSDSISGGEDLDSVARKIVEDLSRLLKNALRKPNQWAVFEDYVIFFIESFSAPVQLSSLLKDGPIAELILGEGQERLAEKSRGGITEYSFQYAENDLSVIDWNSAVVVEPSGSRDIPDVIEFSLTHLLEFRYYDDLLDRRLSDLYDSLEERRGGIWRSGFESAMREANSRFIELSEFIERVDNSLKVVGDFYVAVIYRAAIRRFRIPDWQSSITRKLNLLGRVSELLQGEVNVHRAHTLEVVVILLIGFEILSALLRHTS
jgi:hypothetical protein